MGKTVLTTTNESGASMTTNLFGLPYQFTKQVDPRVIELNKDIGAKYMENIMLEGPVVTIIPGKANYLPGQDAKLRNTLSGAFVQAMADSDAGALKKALESTDGKYLRLYDFSIAYEEYMQYVNALCRTAASMLEIGDYVYDGSKLAQYDWRRYKWNNTAVTPVLQRLTAKKSDSGLTYSKKTKEDVKPSKMNFENIIKEFRYVQFYVDSDGLDSSDGINNGSKTTQLSSIYSQMTDTMKDISFMLNSGDGGKIDDFITATGGNLSQYIGGFLGSSITDQTNDGIASGLAALSRIVNLTGNAIRGENLAIPNIWGNSTRTNDFSLNLKLRTPYGNKFGYYFDILVPMLFAVALAFPKQTTANTFGAPFLVKVYVEGQYSCSLGMVSGITIRKTGESRSVDGYPCEVEISLSFEDLYPNISISPANSAAEFLGNSALVEFIATNCGLSIANPNIAKKAEMLFNTLQNRFKDVPANISNTIGEQIMRHFSWAKIR